MRFVALMLAVTALTAGLGLASITPVQAHGGGTGGDQLGVTPAPSSCEAVVAEDSAASYKSCGDSHDRAKP